MLKGGVNATINMNERSLEDYQICFSHKKVNEIKSVRFFCSEDLFRAYRPSYIIRFVRKYLLSKTREVPHCYLAGRLRTGCYRQLVIVAQMCDIPVRLTRFNGYMLLNTLDFGER